MPKEVTHRQKYGGFSYEVYSLFNNTTLKEQILSSLSEWNLIKKGYFKDGYIKHILEHPVTPKLKRQYNLILFLLGLEIWNNIYIEGDSVQKPESKYLYRILLKD
jgi:hypothetical protein